MEEHETLPFEAVRRRPAMYVGDTEGGSGIVNMVLEVVANACDQHLAGRCTRIGIELAADGTITVEDDGPGIPVQGGERLPALEIVLARRFDEPTADGHRPHVHLGFGGVGIAVVNGLSERFELITVRGGVEARAAYARGQLVAPLATRATDRASGTVVRFRPDPTIFRHVRAPRDQLTRVLEDLSFLVPGLSLRWAIAGDAVAAGGLAALVALRAPCAIDGVARHRESYETAGGPIDVEVALAWRPEQWQDEPAIDSFVNLARTREHGSHVQGLLDGVHAFVGGRSTSAGRRGLVGAVAVVLADVRYGIPTKDRLETPEARGPVADATRKALAAWAAWAAMHPEAAAALRARGGAGGPRKPRRRPSPHRKPVRTTPRARPRSDRRKQR
jgi:DNA gyrase subunit B